MEGERERQETERWMESERRMIEGEGEEVGWMGGATQRYKENIIFSVLFDVRSLCR